MCLGNNVTDTYLLYIWDGLCRMWCELQKERVNHLEMGTVVVCVRVRSVLCVRVFQCVLAKS